MREVGVLVAFSERNGGVSATPYASLNLAAHVGDDPAAVDANRGLLLSFLGLESISHRLTTAEQVHGTVSTLVRDPDAGCGSLAAGGRSPISGSDALLTRVANLPLLLCFADCVPVVLVAPGPSIAVVHAGWRGALAGIVEQSARRLAAMSRTDARAVIAYVGPHIQSCHYEVSDEILSQFVNAFDTVARAESGGLDLGFVVAASLRSAGVDPCNIASLGACTAEMTDRFFSHRAEAGLTGRHGAVACILS
jgi:YfiH family protein